MQQNSLNNFSELYKNEKLKKRKTTHIDASACLPSLQMTSLYIQKSKNYSVSVQPFIMFSK